MLAEEGYFQRNNNFNQQEQGAEQGNEAPQQQPVAVAEEAIPDVSSQLPAFLTTQYDQPQKPIDPATIQNWEERDA